MLAAVAYRSTKGVGEVLLGHSARRPDFSIEVGADPADYYRLRTEVFVHRQGLFTLVTATIATTTRAPWHCSPATPRALSSAVSGSARSMTALIWDGGSAAGWW